jgi:hypothetical protein
MASRNTGDTYAPLYHGRRSAGFFLDPESDASSAFDCAASASFATTSAFALACAASASGYRAKAKTGPHQAEQRH